MQRSQRIVAWLVFLFFLAVYLLCVGEGVYSTDGETMLRATWSIVDRHQLAIPCSSRLPNAVPGLDGRCYSRYGLGQPLAAIPLYLLAKGVKALLPSVDYVALIFLFVPRLGQIITALTCALLFSYASRLYRSTRLGVGLALAYGLGTMAWPYAKYYFNAPLVTLCLLGAAYLLFVFREQGSPARLALAGSCLGYAFLTNLSSLATLPFFLAYALRAGLPLRRVRSAISKAAPKRWVSRICPPPTHSPMAACRISSWSQWLIFLAPAVFLLGVSLAYNLYAFGNLVAGGYGEETWSTPLYVGLYGLLLSSGKSLFLYVPLTIVVPLALVVFYRTGRQAETFLFAALFVVHLLLHAGWWSWYGGWSWGPRFLVPALPFLILPLGALWPGGIARQIGLIALAIVSVWVQFLGVAVDFNHYMLMINDLVKLLFIPEFSPLVGHLQLLLDGELDLSAGDLLALGVPQFVVHLFHALCFVLAIGAGVALGRAATRRQEASSDDEHRYEQRA